MAIPQMVAFLKHPLTREMSSEVIAEIAMAWFFRNRRRSSEQPTDDPKTRLNKRAHEISKFRSRMQFAFAYMPYIEWVILDARLALAEARHYEDALVEAIGEGAPPQDLNNDPTEERLKDYLRALNNHHDPAFHRIVETGNEDAIIQGMGRLVDLYRDHVAPTVTALNTPANRQALDQGAAGLIEDVANLFPAYRFLRLFF